MAKQINSGLTPEQLGAIYRAQKADDFKAIVEHLKAVYDMLANSDLDSSEILSVFSNAGIPVFPIFVQDILALRYVKHGR